MGQAVKETPENTSHQERVELRDEEDEGMLFSGPVSCAEHLCDEAELTREQRGPVALLARDMQHAYEQELARRALLTDAERRAEGTDSADVVRLPIGWSSPTITVLWRRRLWTDTDHQTLC